MNKKEFIKALRKDLSILSEKEVDDIILEYTDNIEQKVKEGKTEQEAVEDFGDYKEFVKGILEAYKLNVNKGSGGIKKEFSKVIDDVDQFFTDLDKEDEDTVIDKISNVISKFVTYIVDGVNYIIKDLNLDKIGRIILILVIVLGLGVLIKIPFDIFEWAITWMISIILGNILNLSFVYFIISMIKIVINLLYLAVLLVVGIKIFRIFNSGLDAEKISNEIVKNVQIKKTTKENVKDEPSKENEEANKSNSLLKSIYFIFVIILKVCAVFVAIPVLAIGIVAGIFFGLTLIGLLNHISSLSGVAFALFGGLLIVMSLLKICFNFIMSVKIKNIYEFIFSCICGFILIGFGCGVLVHDLNNLEYKNYYDEIHDVELKQISIKHNDDISYRFSATHNIEFIEDDNLIDTMIVEAELPEVVNIYKNEYLKETFIEIGDYSNPSKFETLKRFYNITIDGLKEGVLYYYSINDFDIVVRIPKDAEVKTLTQNDYTVYSIDID